MRKRKQKLNKIEQKKLAKSYRALRKVSKQTMKDFEELDRDSLKFLNDAEVWVFKNKKVKKAISQGLKEAAAGKVHKAKDDYSKYIVDNPLILLTAISFAARKHKDGLRKDGVTPYFSHPFRVAMTVAEIFGVHDPEIIAAAILHDTLEDTETSFTELKKKFGVRVAKWVKLLSKNESLPKEKREAVYMKQLASAPPEVKLVKYADIHDNLLDAKNSGPKQFAKTLSKTGKYLAVLSLDPHPSLKRPLKIVQRIISK